MEHQDQKPVKTLESRMSKCPEDRQDKSCVTETYCAPQVFLVENAKRLMAAYSNGYFTDYGGWWCFTC